MSLFYSSKHERCDIECPVEFIVDLDSGETFQGIIQNISESGICLITSEQLENGQEITITTDIFLPSHTASVCWIEQLDGGKCKAGLEFV